MNEYLILFIHYGGTIYFCQERIINFYGCNQLIHLNCFRTKKLNARIIDMAKKSTKLQAIQETFATHDISAETIEQNDSFLYTAFVRRYQINVF